MRVVVKSKKEERIVRIDEIGDVKELFDESKHVEIYPIGKDSEFSSEIIRKLIELSLKYADESERSGEIPDSSPAIAVRRGEEVIYAERDAEKLVRYVIEGNQVSVRMKIDDETVFLVIEKSRANISVFLSFLIHFYPDYAK
jgi:hypothetical protein